MEPTKDSEKIKKTTATVETTPVEEGEKIDKDATIVTGQAGDQPVTVVMNPPKKHKVGIIVGIVVFLLFLIGGISLAVWYFCIYNSPEVVAYDAMRQLITAEHVSTTGTVRIAEAESLDGFINVAELEFNSSSMSLPNSTSVSLNISQRYEDNDQVVDDHEISLDLGFVVMSDGVIYLQVEHLIDTIDKAIATEDTTLDDFDDTVQFAYAIAELIDNQWWQISLGDILDELDFDSTIADPVTDFYDCILSAAGENANLAKLYDAHRFVEITKTDQAAVTSGTSRYQVALNYEQMANFVNALPETTGGEKTIVCYNDLADEFDFSHISAKDFPKVKAKDFEKALPSDYQLYLEISNFGHQLKRVEAAITVNGVKIDGFLNFDYSAVEATAPSDYRPITDLFEDAFELFGEYFYGISGTDPYPYQNSGVVFI